MEVTLLWAALTAAALGWLGTRVWPEALPDRPADRLLGAGAIGLLVGRIIAMLSSFFGGLAVLLAGIGLYGIVAQAVRARQAARRGCVPAPAAGDYWLITLAACPR